MSVVPSLALGLLLGAVAIWAHLALLRGAIARAVSDPTADNRGHILRTAPLRIAVWLPVLFMVARLGLTACLGALASMLVTRALLIGWMLPSQGHAGGH